MQNLFGIFTLSKNAQLVFLLIFPQRVTFFGASLPLDCFSHTALNFSCQDASFNKPYDCILNNNQKSGKIGRNSNILSLASQSLIVFIRVYILVFYLVDIEKVRNSRTFWGVSNEIKICYPPWKQMISTCCTIYKKDHIRILFTRRGLSSRRLWTRITIWL